MVGPGTLNEILELDFDEWVHIGIYTCLFVSAMSTILRSNRRYQQTRSGRIFLVSICMMYVTATLHLVVLFYRYIRGFILFVDINGGFFYVWDYRRWDNLASNILTCLIIWLGDLLVIYRAYIVWESALWVVIAPVIILLASLGINIYTLYWFTHPSLAPVSAIIPLLDCIYPLAFAQNFITTVFIALKIWAQHRMSKSSGVVDRSSRLSLMRILRIVVESAMVYTVQLLILIILQFSNTNSFQVVFQAAIIPSTGIVFVLIAVRVQAAKIETFGNSALTVPAWVEEGDSDIELHRSRSPSTPDAFKVSSQKLDGNHGSEPFASSSLTHHRKGLSTVTQ
ncbi:hypothetical protein CPC08DRAFT_497340 [Agrocybe pediades]|nr:hypothetical protein CPC08DRAFT_497340 [Agrocybe pediades]